MHERRRLAVLCGLVWLACAAVFIGAALRLPEGAGVAASPGLLLTAGLAVFGVGAALALLWSRIDLRVLTPLERLEREIDTILHAEPERALDVGAPGAIESLVGRVGALVERGDRARRDLAVAVAAATDRLEDERSRLAAVLRDLSEGGVVCGEDHRVLLFNAAARRTLDGTETMGLGRSLFDTLAREPVETAFERLRRDGAREPDEIALGELSARMALVIEPDGAVIGYVLSFAGAPEGGPGAAASDLLPPRPVFYDFDPLNPAPVSGAPGHSRLAELSFVVFDTETTGLKPEDGDEIVQIGAVRVVGGSVREFEIFETLVDPERQIPDSSTRFHGLTDDDVAGAPDIANALARLRDFVGDAVLVAQNAAFDMRFVRNRQNRAGVAFDMPVLDTMLLSVHLHPEEADHTLDALAARYGVAVAGRHTALGDALVTASVFCRMLPLLDAGGIETLDDARTACDQAMHRFRR